MTDGLEDMGLPPLGHNKPPEPMVIDRAAELVRHCNRWIAERPVITDAEMAGAAQTFTDQLRAVRDDLGNELRRERRPHDDAIEHIKRRYADPQELVRIALDKMAKLNTDWLQRERVRLDQERIERERQAAEAKRKADEAIERAVTQPSVEAELEAQRATEAAIDAEEAAQVDMRPQVKGDYAARAMSLRSNWKARVVDFDSALKHFCRDTTVVAAATKAIEQVGSKLAKAQKGRGPIPPGVAFYNDERAQ